MLPALSSCRALLFVAGSIAYRHMVPHTPCPQISAESLPNIASSRICPHSRSLPSNPLGKSISLLRHLSCYASPHCRKRTRHKSLCSKNLCRKKHRGTLTDVDAASEKMESHIGSCRMWRCSSNPECNYCQGRVWLPHVASGREGSCIRKCHRGVLHSIHHQCIPSHFRIPEARASIFLVFLSDIHTASMLASHSIWSCRIHRRDK